MPRTATTDGGQRAPGEGADAAPPGWLRRVGWLLLIWLASVSALAVVAYLFRFVMGWAGLTR